MEQFSSHDFTLRVDPTPEGSDMVLGDDLFCSQDLQELRAHVATRGVVDLSDAEINALIEDLGYKKSDPDSDGLSPLEEYILHELNAYAEELGYTDDLNSQPLAQVR